MSDKLQSVLPALEAFVRERITVKSTQFMDEVCEEMREAGSLNEAFSAALRARSLDYSDALSFLHFLRDFVSPYLYEENPNGAHRFSVSSAFELLNDTYDHACEELEGYLDPDEADGSDEAGESEEN
jgi:hypothetical protein